MLIYLSHPIDRANDEVKTKVTTAKYEFLTALLNHKTNAVVFKPQDAFFVSKDAQLSDSIESINQAALKRANAMVVLWPHGSSSWGVPVEVERAVHAGMPIAFLIEDAPTWSMPLAWHDSEMLQGFEWDEAGIEQAVLWLELVAKSEFGQDLLPTKLMSDQAQLPTKAYADDAGFDLHVSEETWIQPGEFVDVPCAVAVELPSDTWALLTGRSSTLRRHKLMVNQGVIDPGYRGELFAGVWNLGSEPIKVEVGDRLAQLILMPNRALNARLVAVNELAPHQRGQSGFGSSGR